MTIRTRAQLNSDADTYLPTNGAGGITAEDVRQRIKDIADSAVFPEDVQTNAHVDELRVSLMMLQLLVADILNVPSWIGPSGNFFADSFETLTYVDVAGATNLNTATAGALKPGLTGGGAISGATGTSFGNMTGGGGVNAVFDGNTSKNNAASASTTSGDSGYVGKNYSGVGGKRIEKVVVTASNQSGFYINIDPTVTITLYHKTTAPANESDGTAFGTFSGADAASGTFTVTSSDQSTLLNYVWVRLSGGSGGNTAFIAQCVFHEAGTLANVTVESQDYLAASAPTQMQVVMFVREEVAATAGTDYSLKLTRNDAAYGSAVSLTELYSLVLADGSTVRVVRTDVEDVSGLTSGTEPGWRFQTLTNKMAYPVGAVTYWS